jgi:hypothetical protein
MMAACASALDLAALQWRTQRLVGVERSLGRTLRSTLGAHALDTASTSAGIAGGSRFESDAARGGASRQRASVGCLVER